MTNNNNSPGNPATAGQIPPIQPTPPPPTPRPPLGGPPIAQPRPTGVGTREVRIPELFPGFQEGFRTEETRLIETEALLGTLATEEQGLVNRLLKSSEIQANFAVTGAAGSLAAQQIMTALSTVLITVPVKGLPTY